MARFPASRRRSPCPVACTLDLLGDKWTLLVVRDLILGRQCFDEFLASPEGIATNILSNRLAMLARSGIVRKRIDPADRRRVRYKLTPKGASLKPVLKAVAEWGMGNLHGTRMLLTQA